MTHTLQKLVGFDTIMAAAIGVAWICGVPLLAQGAASRTLENCFGVGTMVQGRLVGPEDCRITREIRIANAHGVPYRRIEMGVSGSIDGYAVKNGPRVVNFTDVPELGMGQKGNLGPYYHGVGVYRSDKGSGMTLFFPESAEQWNGKLFVIVHGGTRPYQPIGELVPRTSNRFNPLMGANHYAGLMIDKGYAVAYTRRLVTSSRLSDAGEHGEPVTLDDGSILLGRSYGNHVGMIRDWTLVAVNLVESKLKRTPTRTYFYGISSGAQLGRLFNYAPDANLDAEGRKVFDGMLLNDNGGGWFSPIIPGVFDLLPALSAVRSGEGDGFFFLRPDPLDQLVFADAHARDFAHQIDIQHVGYPRGHFLTGNPLDSLFVDTYFSAKGANARLLTEKGLTSKTRTYEIIGTAHFDAGYLVSSGWSPQNLDLGGVFDALIDLLDNWVDQAVEPPPTRSESRQSGLAASEEARQGGIQLPEIACPTGVYFEFPVGGGRVGLTGFQDYLRVASAAVSGRFSSNDEEQLEPMDRRGYPVDMNHNGIRDRRETLTEAWQRRGREGERYGTLEDGETFTSALYVECVRGVATDLFDQRLLSRSAMLDYIQKATDF
ncbi:MAG: alpha/beta hydrolase domain-containing protein [Acidobacteriota bacterium]